MGWRRVFRSVLLIALLALNATLSSCGGSGGALAGGGTSGTGITQGTVTAFGSVIVNGVEFDTRGARIFVEGTQSTEDALRVGMVVTVRGSWQANGMGTATEVSYDDDVEGPISAIDTGSQTVTVLGQTVHVDGDTVYAAEDGTITGLADLQINDVVEVSGFFEGNGPIIATRLERKSSGRGEYEIRGTVQNLDRNAETFTVGGLKVAYDTAKQIPDGGVADRQFVEVRGTLDGATLKASRIELESEGVSGRDGEDVSLEGLIGNFHSATEFTVDGQPVTTDGDTEYHDGASPSTLAAGLRVQVEGHLSNGVLVAEEIGLRQSGDARLEDRIFAVDGSTFTTNLGIQVEVTSETVLEDDTTDNRFFNQRPGTG